MVDDKRTIEKWRIEGTIRFLVGRDEMRGKLGFRSTVGNHRPNRQARIRSTDFWQQSTFASTNNEYG